MKQGQYNRVDAELTTHHAFRALTERAKLICLFIRANRNNNALGCFYYPLSHICDDLDTPLQGTQKGLIELEKDNFIWYCKRTRWLMLPKHLKKFPILGVNRMKGAVKLFEAVPKDFLFIIELAELLTTYHDYQNEGDKPAAADIEGTWDSLARDLEPPPDYTNTNTTTDTDTNTPTKGGCVHFEEFESAYPEGKFKGVKKALEYWKRDNLDEIADTIIDDVMARQCSDDQWLRGYVPWPQKYLNQEGWKDDIDEKGTRNSSSSKKTAGEEAADYVGKGITIDQ